jgi:hypothetical protein
VNVWVLKDLGGFSGILLPLQQDTNSFESCGCCLQD